MSALDDLIQRAKGLPPEALDKLAEDSARILDGRKWIPNPGPQTDAYFSKADVLLYGGCVDAETEFLTPSGWKRIDQYQQDDLVGQWSPNAALTFAHPIRYIHAPVDGMWHFKTRRLDMMLTADHRVAAFKFDGEFVVKSAEKLASKPSRHWIPVNFTVENSGLELSDNEIRLAVAIHADGSFDGATENYCRISLRKERKKKRLCDILSELNIGWKEYHNPNRPTEVRYSFYAPITSKTYAEWWGANKRQLSIILEEMSHWDGNYSGAIGGDICFSTTVKEDADFMQFVAHACGYFASISKSNRNPLHNAVYRVNITKKKVLRGVALRSRETFGKGTKITWVKQDEKFCFETETSFWVARRNGLIFCTGNCAGGGKSQLIIGLGVNEASRGIIFRRELTQTDGLEADGKSIIGDSARFNGTEREWTWEDGKSLKLGAMRQLDDWIGHAGRERDLMCVVAGTKVLMGDGSYKNIESLRVGEFIRTLEGNRKIEKCHPVQRKNCVELMAKDARGNVIARQVQSVSHAVLCENGWLSSDDLSGVYQSIQAHEPGLLYAQQEQIAARQCKYAHPYKKDARQVELICSLQSVAFEFFPVGEKDVYDLQVEEVNHYITEGGIINKNCFDEAGEFLEKQVSSIQAWLRAPPGQRTRIVLASNPPRSTDGNWLLNWFAPWLDPTFSKPATPGELRWGIYVKDRVIWVNEAGTHSYEGDDYIAKSYTFIPASLEDNPYRNTPEYRAQLQSLPEPLRSQLLYGDWQTGMKDAANQVIPTAWVLAAISRWEERLPMGIPQCAIGVDAAGGGEDNMVLAIRHDGWYAPLIKIPGSDIPQDRSGSYAAGLVVSHRRDDSVVAVDLGGGYGGPLYEHLKANDIESYAYKGAESTTRRTKDKRLGFTNVRSAAYWGFREALDPDQPGGSPIALPNDKRLIAGLTAPTFDVTPRGIKVEPKSHREGGTKGVIERLGFSPDEADAVVMAWWTGAKESKNALEWLEKKQRMKGLQSKSIMGRR